MPNFEKATALTGIGALVASWCGGWDGTEYESAGDAVRGQIADIYDFFITSSEISEVLTG